MQVEDIAHIVHEANRAYCASLGDMTQKPWSEAPDWQKISAAKGVEGIASGVITKPEESHESWLAEKERTGWKYGSVKDEAAKEHPCFVPYKDLPAAQQVKDSLFFAIVRALLPFLEAAVAAK